MKTQQRRIEREQQTIAAMLALYCRDHHGSRPPTLCPQCSTLGAYARRRLETCPFHGAKPACNNCQVHCYSATMRERVKAVMRYSGPRMLWRHPRLALMHLIDTSRGSPRLGS